MDDARQRAAAAAAAAAARGVAEARGVRRAAALAAVEVREAGEDLRDDRARLALGQRLAAFASLLLIGCAGWFVLVVVEEGRCCQDVCAHTQRRAATRIINDHISGRAHPVLLEVAVEVAAGAELQDRRERVGVDLEDVEQVHDVGVADGDDGGVGVGVGDGVVDGWLAAVI